MVLVGDQNKRAINMPEQKIEHKTGTEHVFVRLLHSYFIDNPTSKKYSSMQDFSTDVNSIAKLQIRDSFTLI